MSDGNIIVSICCLAYNHEPFIKECLDGFLKQKASFRFEVLIHDDASTDNTAEIIRQYEKKYPDIIKPIYQTQNQYSKGIKPTFKYNFPRAQGKYIALCEGDDYWTDPLKLQKQVDFLEENEGYVLCAHAVNVLDFEKKIQVSKLDKGLSFNQKELFFNHIPTLSAVFKNVFKNSPKVLPIAPSGDILLWSFLGQFGKYYKMNETMAVYRQHESGVWSGESLVQKIKNSVISRKIALQFLSDKKNAKKYLRRLSLAGANQSLRKRDFSNLLFFTKTFFSLFN